MKEVKNVKRINSNKNSNTARRSEKHNNQNKKNNNNNRVVAHNHVRGETHNKAPKKKIDKNTLILGGVIYFVAVVIFLKTMGLFMASITAVGILLIIAISLFLKFIRRNKVIRVITNLFTILFLLGCIAGVGFTVYFAYIIVSEAPEWNTKNLSYKESSIIYGKDETQKLIDLSTEKRELIEYEEASDPLLDSIVAVEDSRFYQHNGFDPLRFFKAGLGQVMGRSDAGGASTIPMQVIKISFTDANQDKMNSEGIKRKFTDIYLSIFKLEKEYSKEQIMEFYMNNYFLGSNSYGVEQAAQTYFGKSASQLTIAEAATIAGLYQAPDSYNPLIHVDAATERRWTVLDLMYTHGYITKEERDLANSIPISSLLSSSSSTTTRKYQSYIDTVITEIQSKHGINPYTTSLKIFTNIDLKKQQGLDDIFNGKTFKWENKKVQAGIAAVDVWTGKIVAIAGGRNLTNEQRTYNRAASPDFVKQIGSTAKPLFDYGPAMEYNGYSTYTLIKDEKYYYSSGQEIRNSDRSYMGTITLRTALAQSRNVPALKTFQKVKNENIYKFVTSLGIKPETSNGSTYLHEAHAIGSFNGANPLQMAAAYAAFANGGTYYEPYTINKIVFRDTGETIDIQPNGTKAMSDSTAFMITYCLQTAVTDGLSSGAAVKGINVAAKTGTTNFTEETARKNGLPDYAVNDAWIVGYDPDTAIGMWYGYDKIYKGTNYFLKSAISGYRVNVITERNRLFQTAGKVLFSSKGKKFKAPSSVVKVAVEMGTNPAKLASSATPSSKITYEYFKKDTEPKEVSPKYNKLANVKNLSANYDVLTNSVNLSWNAVSKGKDYDESYGQVGYKIYFNNDYLGFTTDTFYTISNIKDPAGTYKVVTTYENYNETDSSGATYKITAEQLDTSTYDFDFNLPNSSTIPLNSEVSHCLKNGEVDGSCVTLYKDGQTIVSGYKVKVTIKDENNDTIEINSAEAATYTVTIEVTYNNKKINKTITIEVK